MPISLEPDKRFSVILDSDADKPIETRPTFYAKSQTMRGHLQTLEVLDRINAADATPQILFEETCKELRRVLVGWSNMGSMQFEACDLTELLTYTEARELLRKVAYNLHLDTIEKKD